MKRFRYSLNAELHYGAQYLCRTPVPEQKVDWVGIQLGLRNTVKLWKYKLLLADIAFPVYKNDRYIGLMYDRLGCESSAAMFNAAVEYLAPVLFPHRPSLLRVRLICDMPFWWLSANRFFCIRRCSNAISADILRALFVCTSNARQSETK